jgi:hypothetical protein
MVKRNGEQHAREPAGPADQPAPADGRGRQDQLATMKAEIDALQISALQAERPWYRQASVMIALLALFFSIATTFYSLKRTHEQDVHNAKVELRDLIQRLTAVPVRNLDLDRKYPRDPTARVQASSLLNTENIVLAKQAVDIIDEIPDDVSSVEYYAVASALAQSGDYGTTRDLYARALASAQDATDFTAAARSLGVTAFSVNDVARGRSAFEQARDVFDRFPTANLYYRTTTNINTEVSWAQAEIVTGNCPGGLDHLGRAETALAPLQDDVLIGRLRSQAAALREQADQTCG